MNLSEDSEAVRIRYVPFAKFIGGFFLYIGFGISIVALMFSAGQFSPDAGSWASTLFCALILLAILISFVDFSTGTLLFAPLVTVNLSISEKYVEIGNQRIYGKSVRRYAFHQVAQFKSYKGKINLTQSYFLALVRSNRKTLKLRLPIGDDKQETVKLIKKLNKIIRNK